MGHRLVHALYLRSAARERVIDAIRKRLADDGFERVPARSRAAPNEVRMLVRSASAGVFVELGSTRLSVEEGADALHGEEWAELLSGQLGEPAIVLWLSEDGYGTKLSRFETGEQVASFAIDEEAAASRRRRFPVDSSVLGTGRRAAKVVLEPDPVAIADALGKALAIPRTWLDPFAEDAPSPGDEVLVFRRRAAVPVLPRGAPKWTGFEPEVASYCTREHAAVALAFAANADLETVSEHLSTFLQAFCPADGLVVRASRGRKTEVLSSRFTRTSSVSARQLARGGSLELAQHHVEAIGGRCVQPIFWIASRSSSTPDEGDDADDERPLLRFGACIGRPGADAPERAIADALSIFVEACVELEGCISAIVTAQRAPLTLASPRLAYEALAGTGDAGARADWLRSHVRSPGWLVLVPRSVARDMAKTRPDGVSVERVRGGLLARLAAPSPFAMESLGPMERWLLPVLGR